ncbi:MAG: DUF2157 domain-containing protein [Nitrospirae bacterium]|nr:DUF2157 domain-containing protein [Nitrospirota bacterium]
MTNTDGDNTSFIRKLRQESELWLSEGIIDSRQRDAIMARYREAAEPGGAVIQSQLIFTLSILGALLLGAGLILFFSANWSAIPKWGKISLIFAGMLSSYGTGYYLGFEKGNYPRVGASLVLLGSIIFGAGIFLTAQAYNVSSHSAAGILMWGAGILPVAYALRLKPVLVLSIVTMLGWLFVEVVYGLYSPSGNFDLMPFLLLGAGLTLWGIGLMHEEFDSLRPLSSPYVVAGLPLTFLATYVFTFSGASRVSIAVLELPEVRLILIVMGSIIVLSQALRFFATRRPTKTQLIHESLLMLLMIVFAAAQLIYSHFVHIRAISVLLYNLIYAAAILWIIYIGYLKHMRVYVNMGVLFFALDVIGRYVDILWGMLHTSLFFVLGGALLIALGVALEKKRRRLLAAMGSLDYAD